MLSEYESGKFLRDLDGIGVMGGSVYEPHTFHPLVMSLAEELAGRQGGDFEKRPGDSGDARVVLATAMIVSLMQHMAEQGYAIANVGTADHKRPEPPWNFQRPDLVAALSPTPSEPS
jgi:hypothetical protein